jgi:hypothetical protein
MTPSGHRMRARYPARGLAVAVGLACLGMMAFSFLSLVVPGVEMLEDRPGILDVLIFTAIFMTFPIVGLVVSWQRPEHPVGWLFLLVAFAILMSVFATEYAGRVAFAGADLPAANLIAWAGGWTWVVAAGIGLPLAIILFPDGRLPHPSWRAPVIIGSLAMGITLLAFAIDPRPLGGYDSRFENPFAVSGPIGDVAMRLVDLGTVAIVLTLAPAIAAIVLRFRRSTGVERQQLKLVLFPATCFVSGLIAAAFIQEEGLWTLALFGLASVAVGVGVAILRYRLYDIDLVIRRTLVYGALVAILGLVYVGLVIGLQAVLVPLTGGDTLPVALSTLAIAALFGPVRARVRALVDRRFYRSRYDAQQIVGSFAGRLRDEVEVEAVGRALLDATGRAVRPSAATIWIRRGSSR